MSRSPSPTSFLSGRDTVCVAVIAPAVAATVTWINPDDKSHVISSNKTLILFYPLYDVYSLSLSGGSVWYQAVSLVRDNFYYMSEQMKSTKNLLFLCLVGKNFLHRNYAWDLQRFINVSIDENRVVLCLNTQIKQLFSLICSLFSDLCTGPRLPPHAEPHEMNKAPQPITGSPSTTPLHP